MIGWEINGEAATADAVAAEIAAGDPETLEWTVSVDGVEVGTGTGLGGAWRIVEQIQTEATMLEKLCYALGVFGPWAAVYVFHNAGIVSSTAVIGVCVALLIGMVMVNRRIGLGPLD